MSNYDCCEGLGYLWLTPPSGRKLTVPMEIIDTNRLVRCAKCNPKAQTPTTIEFMERWNDEN